MRDPRDRAAQHCGCTVIGHGVESDGRFCCGASCASAEGVRWAVDRIDSEPVATA